MKHIVIFLVWCYYQSIEFLCGYGGKVPKELVGFLEFLGANVEESEKDYGNSLIRQVQRTIRGIKTDREIGEIPEELRKEIEEIDNLDFLKTLHKKAARTESGETFETELKKLFEAVKEK